MNETGRGREREREGERERERERGDREFCRQALVLSGPSLSSLFKPQPYYAFCSQVAAA